MDGSNRVPAGRAGSSVCAPPGSSREPWHQNITFHRELANLGMKVADFGLMVTASPVGTVRKHRAKPLHGLTLPCAHLFGYTWCFDAISWIVLSPRIASSATRDLKSDVNRRRLVI